MHHIQIYWYRLKGGTNLFYEPVFFIGGYETFGRTDRFVGGTKHLVFLLRKWGTKHFVEALVTVRNILDFSVVGYETFPP